MLKAVMWRSRYQEPEFNIFSTPSNLLQNGHAFALQWIPSPCSTPDNASVNSGGNMWLQLCDSIEHSFRCDRCEGYHLEDRAYNGKWSVGRFKSYQSRLYWLHPHLRWRVAQSYAFIEADGCRECYKTRVLLFGDYLPVALRFLDSQGTVLYCCLPLPWSSSERPINLLII